MSKYCSNCGNEVEGAFCTQCGTPCAEEQNNSAEYSQPNYEQPNYNQQPYAQPNYNQPYYGQMPIKKGSAAGKAGSVFTILSVLLMTMFFILFIANEDFVREMARGLYNSGDSTSTGIASFMAMAFTGKLFTGLFVFYLIHTALSVISIIMPYKNATKVSFFLTLFKVLMLVVAFIVIVATISSKTISTPQEIENAATWVYGGYVYAVMCLINGVFWLASIILYAVGMGKEKNQVPMNY